MRMLCYMLSEGPVPAGTGVLQETLAVGMKQKISLLNHLPASGTLLIPTEESENTLQPWATQSKEQKWVPTVTGDRVQSSPEAQPHASQCFWLFSKQRQHLMATWGWLLGSILQTSL